MSNPNPENKIETRGRRKGIPNKSTERVKATFNYILERKIEKVENWIDLTAAESPEKAVKLLLELAEYIMPKKARVETVIEQDKPTEVVISWKKDTENDKK